MLKVDNQGIILEISKRTYKANRKRNILTILAIIFTTLLITTILGIGIGYWNMLSDRSVKMEGMDYDIELTEPTEEQMAIARNMEQIKYAGLYVKCAVIEGANEEEVSKVQLYWADDTCWQEQCLPAFASITGGYPRNQNELLLSTAALRAMGITDPAVGITISVTYYPLKEHGNLTEPLSYKFQLCGYFKDYTGTSRGFVSPEFYQSTGAKQTDFTQGSLIITLNNPIYSSKTIYGIQEQFGLENKQMLIANEDLITGFVKTILVLLLLLVMIFVSGYLFIFNTLYISVAKDIRYYGQLKTIGMTSVQLKRVIYLQAIRNSCIGIPAGLLAGFFVSVKVIPAVLRIASPSLSGTADLDVQPLLFVIAALFSFITVFVGCRKPALIAGNCSPIEAIRYVAVSGRKKKSDNGLRSMAWRNMFRNKKQAAVILLSFVISLMVFLTINVVIRANDARRILNEICSCDLTILNETVVDEDKQQTITEDKIQEVKEVEGVEEVRVVYSETISVPYQEEVFGQYYKDLYQSRYSPGNYEEDISAYKQDQYMGNSQFETKLVAIDEAGFDELNESTGNILDKERFEAGEIAATCVFIDVVPTEAVGENVTFSLADTEIELEIAAIGEEPDYFASGYTPDIIVSDQFFMSIVKEPVVELIDIDYTEAFDQTTEQQIKDIFTNTDNITYQESKLDRYDDMLTTEQQVKVLGAGIGVILAALAILNFINMMAACVQNRKKEFAALESIGMTTKQIKNTLAMEGIGYAGISIIAAVVFGIPVSYIVFKSMNIYRMSYSLPILTNIVLFLVILIICMIIPPAIYQVSQKESILERLRENDE